MIDNLAMSRSLWVIGLLGVLLFLGACSVKQNDTYGVVSFQIKNVD